MIFHQRNEWGDDHRHPLHLKGRELIAEGFAATCGKDDQGIATLADCGDSLLLEGTPDEIQANPKVREVYLGKA